MPDMIAEVTTEFLEAFADAWNRHDADALMSFMSDDCVFEASAGPDICGSRNAAVRPCEPASLKSGQPSPMPTGAARAISCTGTEGFPSGRLRGHGRTALASRSMVVTCSPFATARSH